MADLLNPDALHHSLHELDGWNGTTEQLSKTYEFPDFAAAIAFVDRVAEHAEAMDHHPDIHVRWNKVTLEIASHAAGGVTQECVALARRADAALQRGSADLRDR